MTATPDGLAGRVGFRLAQLSAALHVLGGLNDLLMQRLQPFHEAFLGYGPGAVPEATSGLILALLHALGAALVVGGVTMWILLRLMRNLERRELGWVVGLLALGLEGSIGARMLQLDLVFGYVPLAIAALAVVGVALCFVGSRVPQGTASR